MRKTKKQRFRASILAFLLIASMVLGMVPGSAGQVYAKESTSQTSSEEEPGFIDKAVGFLKDKGEKIASFLGAGNEAQPAAAFDETSVVDEDTKGSWTDIVEKSTKNIGRIWTDKSVYNGNVTLPGIGEGGQEIPITKPKESDFMVGLSALSSTSNTSVTTSTPLDIVLVLDVSGSMSNNLGTSYVYSEVYNINTDGGFGAPDYYALDKTGQYVEVERVTRQDTSVWWPHQVFDHWELNSVKVVPKTSRDDNDPNHIQFYTRQSVNVSKIDGLKSAVNGFIDATAEQNETITDPDKKHQISIVKYADDSYYNNDQDSVGDHTNPLDNDYNYSEIVSNLTGDMASLKNAVYGLEPAGATAADYGMTLANRVLNSSAGHGVRANAKKVVVMFTDGEPNYSRGFSGTVADAAITSAKTLKDAGALVYSIGVVSGADPGDTSSKLNSYLHGISSNYPAATGYQSLGDRAANSNYYKAATNSEELNNIFKEISEEINTGTGYPTETKDGYANTSGYVTFHDQLGDYMQVDSFNKLVLEDMVFENLVIEEKTEGVTYTYSGQAGENKNVSDIVITVTKGTGSMGDTVDVRIPASLLPLRHFKVDVSNNTMTVEDKYPLRLFYNASLKEDAKKALAKPDQKMKNYIANNAADGKVYFYSNKFTGSKQGPTLGDTTATFEPATGNSFYYFTENTPLWADEAMTVPVTSNNADETGTATYYYAKTYYELNNGAPEKVTEAVSFRSHPQDEVQVWVDTAPGGQLYIKAGAPRLTRIHDLTSSKEINATETATEVITPNWDDEQAPRNIEVSLGNNGRLAVELPGTLEIKKTVTSEVEAPKDKKFKFTLNLKDANGEALTGEFDAQKFDAKGATSGGPAIVQNNGTVTLKDGESVKIYGLSNGDKYNIEETQIPNGFTAKENSITGTIEGNATVTAAFENTYAVTPVVLEGDSSIRAKKILTGRDWLDTDSFNIALISMGNAPLPEASEGITIEGDRAIKTVTKSDKDAPDTFNFGKITFTKPGTYTYNIAEPRVSGDARIPGIDYSGAVYRVDVMVTDNGEGSLSATSTMTQMQDDQGHALGENGSGIEDEDKIAEITNDFNATSVSWGACARKEYTDYSGANPLKRDMFYFKVETVAEDGYGQGPLPGGKGSYTVSCEEGGQISFGQTTFDSTYVGKKFLYKITEVLPEGVSADNLTKDGMTYDATEYYLELSFDSVPDQNKDQTMRVTPKYMKVVDGQRVEVSTEDDVVFKNEYRPTPVVVGDETNAAIQGSKTLNGRAMNANEFSFELTAENQAAVNGLTDNSIVFGTDIESNSMTATAPAANNGAKADFDFGKITFTKPGTYTFNMKEVIPADENKAGGLTYDTHTEVVTVTVTDNNGALTANTTYEADGVAFVNTYEASHSYSADGGALVTKTLTGRDMEASEFNFTIEGTGDNKDAADKKLAEAEADKTFTHYAAQAGVASPMRKLQNVQFTEADAGRTFTYLIKEVIPADEKKAGGVTYDQSEFTLTIAVADDGDGTMSTTTTVTRTKEADGTNVNETVGTYTSAEDIVPVPFVNTYKAAPVIVDTSDTEGSVGLRKVLRGRDWHEGESFAFTMTPQDDAPIPTADETAGITVDESGNVHAVVTAPENGAKDEKEVYFGFGEITYDTAGTYVYTVTEDVPDPTAGGMTYSENVATITVTVTDPGTGKLNAVVTVSERTFYNDYTASLAHNAAGGIVTTKTLHGHDMADRQFTFQVEALDGTGTTAAGNAKRIGINDGTTGTYRNDSAAKDGEKITMKTADGNDIEFTTKDIGKTFKYKFSEVKDNQAGYTYDKAVYTVELWVTDDGDGTLTLHTKVTDKDGKETTTESNETPEGKKKTVLDFTNSYAASGSLDGSANLAVTKNLEGRSWNPQDKFFFRLEATGLTASQVGEGGSVQLPDNAKNIEINANSANHKASFGDITFTKPGRYTFAVSESIPGLAVNAEGIVYKDATEEQKAQGGFVLNGITYDGSTKNITVNVVEEDTENGNGKLVATIAQNSDSLTFTNTYNVSSITLNTDQQFNVTKTLVGRDWTDTDAFKFTLTAVNNAPMPVEDENVVTAIKDATTQTFGVITYDKAGTYEYQIKEILPQDKEEGLTYDTHTATVKVKVTENFVTGTLSVESVTYSDGADGAQFTNVLGDNTKEVTSDDTDVDHGMVGVGDELTYTINWVNDGVDENGKPAEATVTITDKIPAGTEFVSAENGGVYEDGTVTWTINAKAAETGSVSFKVKVTEAAGGTAVENKGEIKVGNNEPKVTNKVQTIVPGKKETSKPEKIEEGTILNYEISFVNADGAGAEATVVDKMTTGLEYQVSTATVGGSKIEPTVEGNAASGQTLTWNLTDLADNAKVTITFNVKVTRDALDSVDNSATVNGHKSNVVTTPYPSDDKKTVEDKDGNDQNNGMVGVGDELTYVIDWAADEAGKVTITDIVPTGTEFVSAENGGVHENGTVTWVIKDAKKGQKGSVSFTVKVTGEAGGKDVLNKANVKVGDNNPKVTNEVKTFIPGKDSALAEGDTELQVGDVLTYTISYKNPEDTAATVTITDKLPEGLTFVEASNDGVYANGTLTWTLTNVPAGGAGTVTFKASVNENAKKEIENKATIQVGENSPKYSTDTDGKTLVEDGNLAISKTIAMTEGQGTKIDTEKEFTFTVTLKDTAGKDLTKQYAYTIKNGDKEVSTGNVEHNGTLKLKHGETATITGLPSGAQYTVTETPEAGYTSDKENNTVTGTIPTKETATADFTNTYSVTGSLTGSDALTVTKELVGREWLDTDTFKYRLTAADKATQKAVEDKFITLPENAVNLEITKESAEHKAAFGDIQFTIAGTFKFHVTEQPSGIAGITDDKNAERTVVVKVTDKKDGTLDAVVVKGESEDLTFTNTYGAGTGEDDIAAQIPATKKLTGRDMKAEEFQFEVVTRKADENAEDFKEEVVATGTNKAAKADTGGDVTFAEKDEKLTYTVESLNEAVEAGYAVKEVKEGQSVWRVSYTARELTNNLPGGVKAVEGKTSYDFTIVVTDNNNGTLTAQVQAPEGGIAFENAYTTGGTEVDTDPTDKVAYFNKKLVGRDWLDTDEFTFTITPQNGAPEPKKTIATVEKAEAKEGDLVPFGFGKITFTDADMAGATANEDGTLSKTFTYQITENDIDAKKMPGVTKDIHVATLTITVTDNQQGELSASASMTAENGTFTNTYESSLDYTALSGLRITKVLHGRDMEAGQFTFTVTPEGEDSAEKLGLAEGANEFKNTAKPAGEVDTIDVLAGKNVIFTQADAGKTFTYTVAEKEGNNSAYNYDTVVRTVTIEVADNTDSTLTVTTRVMKDGQVVDEQIVKTADEGQKKATVAFVNTYNDNPTTLGGEGNVKINATKSLTNRPMVDGEFTFHVLDKNQNLVTSGTNSADGTITFDPVTYDTDNLIADEKAGIAKKSVQEGAYVYTYDYTVVEAPTTDGVTGDATTFAIQVIVTDKGDGTLELKVQYPEGTDSLAFKNLYGEGAEAEITINGHKQYEVASGDNEPDITGKYTFTITGSKGAPMPEKTEVTNDAAGNVTFGAITYTMENVFGDTGSKPEVAEAAEGAAEDEAEGDEKDLTEAKSAKREKTFTYTVAESGSVPGVQNDGSSKTFTVKVTDNGNGTIAVEKSWKENEFPFSFTNTYSVTPADYSINTDLTITKELDGRELREGEFTFEMVGEGETVLQEAVNAKDGSVTFGALTYEKPGTYNYVIREQKGSAGGVEYDSAEHTVVVVVTDNGDGTMTAKAELKSRDDEDAKNAIVFKNSYTAQPASVTLGASKAYTGGKLGDGQFTFELRDESDKLISKAKNNENGQIVFETIEYKNVGTYKYKISEVNDEQKHVTYDKTVYGVTVTVTDNQEGSLMAAVEYDGGKAPVFTNKYSKPAKPAKPEEPKGPTAVKTGDETPVIPFIILMVATLAIIVTITFIFFRRKRR